MHAIPSVNLVPAFFLSMGGVRKYPLRPGVISPTIIPPIWERNTLGNRSLYPILVNRYCRRLARMMFKNKYDIHARMKN